MDMDSEARLQLVAALQEGKTSEAVEISQRLLAEFPDDGELNMFAGVALEQVGEVDQATTLLRRATMLIPDRADAFHNLAAALFNQGDFVEARTIANEALRLDPENESALATIAKCDEKRDGIAFEVDQIPVPQEGSPYPRTGLDDQPNYIWNLGGPWTVIGYGLVAYCVFGFAFMVFHPFLDADQKIRHDFLGAVSLFLYATTGIATLFWMTIDIIDRREKFVWLLPVFVCGFMAVPVLPLALYLALGRKVVQMY